MVLVQKAKGQSKTKRRIENKERSLLIVESDDGLVGWKGVEGKSGPEERSL